jgi:hypothetical protein
VALTRRHLSQRTGFGQYVVTDSKLPKKTDRPGAKPKEINAMTAKSTRRAVAGGYAIMCGRLRGLGAHHGQSAFNTARYSSKADVYSLVRQDAKNKVHGQKYFRHRRDFGFVPHL